MNAWKAALATAVGLFRFQRARGFGVAAVCAAVAVAAALDTILALVLDPTSV
ncbi:MULTISPECIES: hypothetical protein [unclassified Mesorhizobium]|uniref:hypothetical protein n=1 Tax=unclassified Mesorhizobium TaxID=325217 RepID=UPI0015E2D11A|nr:MULTISPECIES: hypothetical protein [unclassified Mesorhizobium]MBZ9985288.1 hypothetical protein [Mesorhizobium sp. BR-1-1-8]MCA0008621.1 hypothetical protein [Mesorhizobium sp. B264B1B]MCA0022464.1 hypothetical protein [Mesorhizobium sp. B264B1A]MCA0024458.1 hypothetical protein [Mesorhizobium sp. B263B1A]MCA0055870.1 hypothetical protein [Mesorhizobium sp. B261B1A]